MSDEKKRTVHRRTKKTADSGELRILPPNRPVPENRGRKVTSNTNVRSVLKNPFSDYDRMEAVDGMVVITHSDGHQSRMPPLTMARNIQDTLGLPAEGMEAGLRKRHFRRVEVAMGVIRKALHQQETVHESDARTKAVVEGLKNWHWQGGMKVKGRPAKYTEDHLPEEMQVRYYTQLFDNLKDYEVAGYLRMSREGRIPWELAYNLMDRMNQKREAEENSDKIERISQMVNQYKGNAPGKQEPDLILP